MTKTRSYSDEDGTKRSGNSTKLYKMDGSASTSTTLGASLNVLRQIQNNQNQDIFCDFADSQDDHTNVQSIFTKAEPNIIEFAIPLALTVSVSVEYRREWPSEWKFHLSTLLPPLRFPWLLNKLCCALSLFINFPTESESRFLSVRTVWNNGAVYQWSANLEEEEWNAHVLSVSELLTTVGSPRDLKDSQTPIFVEWCPSVTSLETTQSATFPKGSLTIKISEGACFLFCNWSDQLWSSFWHQLVEAPDLSRPISVRRVMDARQHLLLKWIEMCEQRGAHPALIDPQDRVTTYAQMLSRARLIASALQIDEDIVEGDVVAVDAPRELGLPVWILAIWMVGGVYLPLGARDSDERKARVFKLSNAKFIITESWLQSVEASKISMECALHYRPGRIAYLTTTSGSTGEPKMIEVSHAAFESFHRARQESKFAFVSADRVLQSSTTTFDPHKIENALILIVGATLLMVPEERMLDTAWLAPQLVRHGCSCIHAVPSLWTFYLSSGETLPKLRFASCGGEALTQDLTSYLRNVISSDGMVLNGFGPSECVIDCSFSDCSDPNKPVTIGCPLASHEMHISAPEGVIGELWIGGTAVMERYLNAPNPCVDGWYPTGDLCYQVGGEYFYVGRRDFQVKLRGQRIELGEIEAVLGHEAVVVKDPAREQLVAFVVAGESELPALKARCESMLPRFMIPSRFVCLGKMPLNLNGKVSRKQLLSLTHCKLNPEFSEQSYSLSVEEEHVRTEWAAVLGVEIHLLSSNQSFESVGGHSLLMATLAHRLGLKFTDILTHPTIAEQASLLSTAVSASRHTVSAQSNQTTGPATFQQRQIYFHGKATGSAYLMNVNWELKVNETMLRRADEVFRVMPELRTVLHIGEDGSLCQLVQDVDQSPVLQSITSEAAEQWMVNACQTIHVDNGPVALFAHITGTNRVIGVVHHTASDGLGLKVIRARLQSEIVVATSPSYLDYAHWQSQHSVDSALGPASLHVDNQVVEMTIPVALLTPAFTVKHQHAWPSEWIEQLGGMSQHLRFPWLLGKLCRALSLFTSRCGEHMVVASVVGNRWLETVGVMVNTVLYHWDRSLGEEDWVTHVQEVQSGSECSLEALNLPLHPDSRMPLTNTMVSWEINGEENMTQDQINSLGLQFVLNEKECTLKACNWSDQIWSSFWHQLVEAPDLSRPISFRQPMDPKQHLLLKWIEMCEQRGAHPALIDPQDRVTTYAQMLSCARLIASALQIDEDIVEGDVVAVDAPRELGLPVWMLAVWMIGAVYIPLGWKDSADRKARMWKLSNAKFVLTEAWLERVPPMAREVEYCPGRIAYLTTTSGSTGEPKIIEVSHSAISSFCQGRQGSGFPFLSTDISMQCAITTFDAYLFENLMPFVTGGTLLLIPESRMLQIDWMLPHLLKHRISYLFMVPSLWTFYISSELGWELPSLRMAASGGEAMSVDLLRLLQKTYPNARINNEYGPAECVVECCIKDCTSQTSGQITFGRPFASHQLHISAPEGVVGELWIGGTVMERYLNAPNPCVDGWYPTGDLCYQMGGEYFYVGRRDFQVKLRGQRIELGEIEAVLGQEAVVVKDPAREQLVAFVVAGKSELPALKARCESMLPRFMIPSRFICLQVMPLNNSGKADRKQLSPLLLTSASDVTVIDEHLTLSEQRVRALWAKVLGVSAESLSIFQPFESVGGHSLLIASLSHKLGCTFLDILKNPTIQDQAKLIEALRTVPSVVIPTRTNQTTGPATFQQRQIYFHGKATGSPYLMPVEWQMSGLCLTTADAVYSAIPELRTVLQIDETGSVNQLVLSVDHSPVMQSVTSEAAEQWIAAACQTIDVDNGPVALFAHITGTNRVIGVVHHTASDGLGLEVIRARLQSGTVVATSPSYLDYAHWQSQQSVDSVLGPASQHVDNQVVEMTIPAALLTPAFTVKHQHAWPSEWIEQLGGMSQHIRFPWLLGKLCRALSLFTSRCGEHMVVASVVGNRWLETAGVMVNTVLYHWDGTLTERQWTAHVQEVQSGTERSLEALKLPMHPDSRLPLTNTMVIWELAGQNNDASDQINSLGLQFVLNEKSCTLKACNWSDQLWSSFWHQLVEAPDLSRPISVRQPMDPRQHLLLQWIEMCEQRGAHPALIDPQDRVTTYAQMLSRARLIASALQIDEGIVEGDVVAVDAPRELGLPVWILAIWMVGGVYVSLGSKDPVDRKARMCELMSVRFIITEAWLERVPPMAREVEYCPGRIAYLTTTSGSTGEPKIIETSHAGIQCFVQGKQNSEFRHFPTDVLMQCTVTTFDAHLLENLVPFLSGCTLLLVPEFRVLQTEWIQQHLLKHRITSLFMVPSLWTFHITSDCGLNLPHLRVVGAGGEALSVDLLRLLQTTFPQSELIVNMYGPAECVIECAVSNCTTLADRQIAIGRAAPSHLLHISAPEGVIGELWIGGTAVMERYLNAPNPCVDGWYPTGDLCYQMGGEYFYVGRRDFQVKLRGQRIELGEIEAVLGHEAVVVKDPAREQLVAFVVTGESELPALKARCESMLPRFMIPSRFVCMSAMLLSSNGKADRKQLLKLIENSTSSKTVLSHVGLSADQMLVCEAAERILSVSVSSLEDDFFSDLGGTSISVAQLSAKTGLSVGQLFQKSTIRGIAESLSEKKRNGTGGGGAAVKNGDIFPLTDVERQFKAVHEQGNYILFSILQTLGGLILIAQYSATLVLAIYLLAPLFDRVNIFVYTVVTVSLFSALHALIAGLWIRVTWMGWHLPGYYSKFGLVHLHWWFLRRMWRINDAYLQCWYDTPVYTWYLKLIVGMDIASDVRFCTGLIDNWDLMTVRQGSFVQDQGTMHNVRVLPETFVLDRITIGRETVIGAGSVIRGGCSVGDQCAVHLRSYVHRDVPDKHEARGCPLEITQLSEPPLGRDDKDTLNFVIQSAIMCFLSALLNAAVSGVRYGVMVYALKTYALTYYIIVFLFAWTLYILCENFFWATVLRQTAIDLPADQTSVRYGSWAYFRMQRLRLLLGRVAPLEGFEGTLLEMHLLTRMGTSTRDNVEVIGPLFPYFQVPLSFVKLDSGATLTSVVWIGEEHWVNGQWTIPHVEVTKSSFIGNNGAFTGGEMPERSTVASLAVVHNAPETQGKDQVAIGNPTMWRQFPAKEEFPVADWQSCGRLTTDFCVVMMMCFFRLLVSITFLLVGFILLQFISNSFVVIFLGNIGAAVLSVSLCLMFKIGVFGKFDESTHEFQDLWFYSRLLLLKYVQYVAGTLWFLQGTEVVNMFLRALGAKIGRRVVVSELMNVLEHDLVSIGDDSVVDGLAQPHTFEGRKFVCRKVTVGERCVLEPTSLMLAGCSLLDDAHLEALSLGMKSDSLPARSHWLGGLPVQIPIRASMKESVA